MANFPNYVVTEKTCFVDADASKKLSFLESIDFMYHLKEEGHGDKVFVELAAFNHTFTLTNLKSLLLQGKVELLRASLDKHGVPIPAETEANLSAVGDLLTFIESTRFAKVSDKYKLDDQTEEFNPKDKFRIGTKDIAMGYSRSAHHVVERLWKNVSQSWFDTDNGFKGQASFSQNIAGQNHNVSVQKNMIRVGCKDVRRYELEALALNMGWSFPNQLSEESKNK